MSRSSPSALNTLRRLAAHKPSGSINQLSKVDLEGVDPEMHQTIVGEAARKTAQVAVGSAARQGIKRAHDAFTGRSVRGGSSSTASRPTLRSGLGDILHGYLPGKRSRQP